jgi:hypothetical protein
VDLSVRNPGKYLICRMIKILTKQQILFLAILVVLLISLLKITRIFVGIMIHATLWQAIFAFAVMITLIYAIYDLLG